MYDPHESRAERAAADTSQGGNLLTEHDLEERDRQWMEGERMGYPIQPALCAECGHAVSLHADRYGCEFERGDAWVEGTNCGGWVAQGPCGCKEHAELRQWPDQCLHRELGVTGIPGVFVCLEAGCGEKIVLPELGVTHRLSVASEERDRNANSKMLLNALKGHI